jgi:hypothetical protein
MRKTLFFVRLLNNPRREIVARHVREAGGRVPLCGGRGAQGAKRPGVAVFYGIGRAVLSVLEACSPSPRPPDVFIRSRSCARASWPSLMTAGDARKRARAVHHPAPFCIAY